MFKMAEVAAPPVSSSLATNGDVSAPQTTNENAAPTTNGDNVTVFHDPENFNVKHPLMNAWTLWFTKPPSGKASNQHTRQRLAAN
jgi:translation initiation factor 4E